MGEQRGTALVTGAGKRIGRATALALADLGYHVAVHYNRSAQEAEETAAAVRERGRGAALVQCDFGDMAQVRNLMTEVFATCPDCNMLVNSASIFEPGPFLTTEEAFFDRHMQVNFKVPFFLARDFARRVERGHIVNLLDTRIAKVSTSHFAYGLTKHALAHFTKMAAKALAPGIRVNGVCPGLILPPPGEDESYLEAMKDRIPLKTHGSAEGIADAVAFLVQSPFVTGAFLFIDGGEHLD